VSENDPRFGYPLEYVKEHVLGCFEASKACAILPGKPHLYHVEFLRRVDSTKIENSSAVPLDFYLEAHFSPCDEVSWYLHTREKEPTYEGSVEADEQFVSDNAEGVVPDRRERARLADVLPEISFTHTLADKEDTYIADVVAANTKRIEALISVPTTPEKSIDSMTDTFGCYSCSNPSKKVAHSRACKARRSRFDKINKEINNES